MKILKTCRTAGSLPCFEKQKKTKCSQYEELSQQFPRAIELKKTGVTLMTLWNEYQREHPGAYSYSRFCYHFSGMEKCIKDNDRYNIMSREVFYLKMGHYVK